jgi:hypothetical protein
MTLPKTQALKDRLQNLGKKEGSFNRPGMGAGPEFVSIVKIVGQEDVVVIFTEKDWHKESSAKRRVD